MITIASIEGVRKQVKKWRDEAKRVALVPTMGNLHPGHLQLIEQAQREADRVVATIFVNPLQFGKNEDFDGYPRTLKQDQEKLVAAHCDLLFVPDEQEIYPRAQEEQTRVEVPGLSDILCGKTRPTHFVGVATVVCKLFNIVQPDVAVFGEKDFQQLLVIWRMAEDLCISVRMVAVPTQREEDGLARSSRNRYLTPDERARAATLFRVLKRTSEAIQQGWGDFSSLELEAAQELDAAGFKTEYFTVRRAQDLVQPTESDQDLVVLAAAVLGKARLIDNIPFKRG